MEKSREKQTKSREKLKEWGKYFFFFFLSFFFFFNFVCTLLLLGLPRWHSSGKWGLESPWFGLGVHEHLAEEQQAGLGA